MNFKEFNSEIENLKNTYGKSKYTEVRVAVMFEYLGSLPLEAFSKQVKKFIAGSDKAPLLTDFEMAFSSQMADLKKQSIEKKLEGAIPCSACDNTGHVTMYDKKTGFEYAYQCTCIRGGLMQPSFPKQYTAMGDEYASHRAWAVGRFDRTAALKSNSNQGAA